MQSKLTAMLDLKAYSKVISEERTTWIKSSTLQGYSVKAMTGLEVIDFTVLRDETGYSMLSVFSSGEFTNQVDKVSYST